LQYKKKSIDNNHSCDFYVQAKITMMHFLYDSLETVKKLKHPTKKDFINLSIGIFALVILAWILFILADTVFSEGYKIFYNLMS